MRLPDFRQMLIEVKGVLPSVADSGLPDPARAAARIDTVINVVH